MNQFYIEEIREGDVPLSKEESTHCMKVLRKQIGDDISLFDGRGNIGNGKITSFEKGRVLVSVNSTEFIPKNPFPLHIAVAPTKQNDRNEWLIEKSVELGVEQITFICTDHSERKKININRYKKIALSAAKQSLSAYLPIINDICKFNDLLPLSKEYEVSHIATLHKQSEMLDMKQLANKSVMAFIGPEGGFTEKEVENAMKTGIQPTRLGSKRLRTETAALFYANLMYSLSFQS